MNKLILSLGNIFDIDSINQQINLTLEAAIVVTLVSLGLGVFLSLIYLFILPVVVSTVIMLVGTNYASAFALAGVFTLIRFRSEPGDPKDISYIFAIVSAGLCCGMGFVLYAVAICLLLGVILLALYFLKFGEVKKTNLKLKILIPEDLNFENAFDDIFTKYNVKAALDKVKTADFGTIYELIYRLNVPTDFKQKEFIDELRTRNGNLNIILTLTDNLYTKNS